MKIILFFQLACFYISSVFSNNFIDIDTLLTSRSQQYYFQEHNSKIHLCTPPRTGSTFVYNVLRFLFENENQKPWESNKENLIVKSHLSSQFEKRGIFVVTIRNPIDACISEYRVQCSISNKILPIKILDEIFNKQIKFMYDLDKIHEATPSMLILQYEKFQNNFNYIFDELESFFSISIADKDKDFLKRCLNKTNVLANTKHYKSFNDFDKFSTFHGNHIDIGELPPTIIDLVKEDLLLKLNSHKALLKRWGYYP
jgi:hypothetical protein